MHDKCGNNVATIIGPWDRRYRVGFDQRLRCDLKNGVDNVEPKTLLYDQLNFFSSFVSVPQLINYFVEENGQNTVDFEDKAILYVPECLEKKYLQKIERSKIGPKLKKELVSVVKAGTKARYRNYNAEISSLIFGHYLPKLLTCVDDENVMFAEEPIESDDLVKTVSKIIPEVIDDPPDQLKDLVKYVPLFETKFRHGEGFAEYWAKGMIGDTNELIIMVNDDQLGYNNLKATVAHEILGHAIFYNLQGLLHPSFFDHGAFALVEGWATWCEWIASCPLFARSLRSARVRTLKFLDILDPKETQEQIAYETIKAGYSDAMVQRNIEYYFQYPGLDQSYTLGALWFEARFREETPEFFFNNLNFWGDFFSSW